VLRHPLKFHVMKLKNDQKKTTQKKVEKIDRSLLHGKKQQSETDRRVSLGIQCTLNQFLTFSNGVSDSKKEEIVNGQLPKKDSDSGPFPPWFARAHWPILRSLKQKNSAPVYEKLGELRKHKFNPKKRNEKSDVLGSIQALEGFLKMPMPYPFNVVSSKALKLNDKFIVKHGIRIKITPDLVFQANLEGKSVFGAIKLLIRKGDILDARQGKMGAYLVHEYMESQKEQFEGEVLPELCLYIDVFRQRVYMAHPISEAPKRHLRESCSEFTEIWRKLEKGV